MQEDYTNRTAGEAGDKSGTRPLAIQLEKLDQQRNGDFRPGAFVKLTQALRTTGFLQALPAEDVKNLLFLLTFITPNGDCHATVIQLADTMQVSQAKVRARMQRLEKFQWQGSPVVLFLPSETGLDRYSLAPHIVKIEQAPPAISPEAEQPRIRAAGREAVIAYSREHYAHPRAEVERMIAEQNGWELPEAMADDPVSQAKWQLTNLGVTKDQAEFLVGSYDLERIERQLQWLPYRNAKSRAGFLVAAIEHDYEEPFVLRIQRATESAETGSDGAVINHLASDPTESHDVPTDLSSGSE